MNDTTHNRFEIDLDEIERQLRRSAEAGSPAPSGSNLDPLAELARIVGQEDPFGSILGEPKHRAPAPPPAPRPAPAFDTAPVTRPSEPERVEPVAPAPVPFPVELTAEDRGVLGTAPLPLSSDLAGAGPRSFDPVADSYGTRNRAVEADEFAPIAPRRSRRRLVLALGAVGVAVLGVGGALTLRRTGGGFATSGPPPLIRADNAPIKVAPENPGGMEIPDQNRQIYEKGADTGKSRVLDRQEQPIDVREAARSLPPSEPPPPVVADTAPALPRGTVGAPASTPNTGPGTTAPQPAAAAVPTAPQPTAGRPSAPPNAVISALGEPRRVRTVAVRPDGSAIGSPAAALAPDPSASLLSGSQLPAPVPVATIAIPAVPAPSASASTPPVQGGAAGTTPTANGPSVAVLPPQRPRASGTDTAGDTAAQTAGLRATDANAATAPADGAHAAPVSVRPPPRPSRRVAAVNTTAPADEAAANSGQPGAQTPTTGRSFSVQLAVRPSEEAARTAYDQLADKYATELGGKPATVTRAEVNGRTVYRVRVAPLSREDANTLCTRLKSSGGQCFVSAN